MKTFLSTMHYYVFTVMLVLLSSLSFSQKKEFNGYYLTLAGDTVKGAFAHYKPWDNSPDKVNFIPTATGAAIQLTPEICKGFAITDYDTYLSYHGTRLTNPIEYNSTTTSNTDNTYETITTFLRQVASSPQLKIYIYKDANRINLFYKSDNSIVELEQKGAILNNNFWESMRYKEQLKSLFPSERDNEKIEELTYTEESIGSYIRRMDKGKGSFKSPDNSNGFIVMAGASVNSLKFSGDKSVVYSSKEYPTTVAPVVALGYMFSISRNFDKFFLFPQLKVSAYKHTATTFFNSTTPYPAQVNTFESLPTISFGFHFGYNIVNNSGLKLFIAPGVGIMMLAKNKQTDKTQFSATEERSTVTALPGTTYLADVQTGLILRKKYVMWFSYNVPATITSYSANKGNLSSLQFGLGYKL